MFFAGLHHCWPHLLLVQLSMCHITLPDDLIGEEGHKMYVIPPLTLALLAARLGEEVRQGGSGLGLLCYPLQNMAHCLPMEGLP